MRFVILLAFALGGLFWWTQSKPAPVPAAKAVTVASAQTKPAAAAPAAQQASWPKTQIDRAQAAADAVKKQREDF